MLDTTEENQNTPIFITNADGIVQQVQAGEVQQIPIEENINLVNLSSNIIENTLTEENFISTTTEPTDNELAILQIQKQYDYNCEAIMIKTIGGYHPKHRFKDISISKLPENGKISINNKDLKIDSKIKDQYNGLIIYIKNKDFKGIDKIEFNINFENYSEKAEILINVLDVECLEDAPCANCN